jgi:hypothetical protein
MRHVVGDADYPRAAHAVSTRDTGFLAAMDEPDLLSSFPTAAAFSAHDLGINTLTNTIRAAVVVSMRSTRRNLSSFCRAVGC